ncbi:MAG TPA: hypothetical protein DD437_12315 [Rhodobiaceae bacterium]|nr:hypothetical protein [Rhodobiaceae bacterium]|tara:strand:- start:7368 stop:8639 length:1272 start_codon:yes stop_codon:yes gene_type:complete
MDAYCSSHVGNDVLLESSIAIVRKIFDNPEIIVHAKQPDAFKDSLGMDCGRRLFSDPPANTAAKIGWLLGEVLFMVLQFFNMSTLRIPPHILAFSARRSTIRDYETCDVAISIGGEMINDSFRKTLPMYLFMFWFARKCGNKTIIFPQSIGPLRRGWTRWMTRVVLKNLAIVSPRDVPSLKELESLSLANNQALFCPDVGLAQPQDSKEDAQTHLSSLGINTDNGKVWIGLTTSAWVEEGINQRNYLDVLVDGLRTLSKTREIGVLLMPANMPVKGNTPSDYNASSSLHASIGDFCECWILPPTVVPARRFKAIAGQLDVFVSTRMHAAILSSMAGTPTITLNTQRKLAGYMALIGQSQFSLEISELSAGLICETVEAAVNKHDDIQEKLIAARGECDNTHLAYARQIAEAVFTETSTLKADA